MSLCVFIIGYVCVHVYRKEYSQLSVQAFPCLVANIVPKNGKLDQIHCQY